MNKINIYLILLSTKYILLNLFIVSIFIFFLNFIEISRILETENNNFLIYLKLSMLKIPTILDDIIPFVIIIGITFLFRNLINNNELISLRNIGLSIFDIFIPIALCVFIIGLIFLLLINPISSNFENKFQNIVNKKDINNYSIKISNNEMWIKNNLDKDNKSFISIENIDLQKMIARNIKILRVNDNSNILIQAEKGIFDKKNFALENVGYFDVNREFYKELDKFNLSINFNKQNILNSITDYKLIPFYKYYDHTITLKKFNLYSSEIGLFYISELLKPMFLIVLTFVVVGYSGKYKRNENFFKILFISILIGFLIFLFKEIITILTISLSLNFFVSYTIIFFLPLLIGLYLIIKIEND